MNYKNRYFPIWDYASAEVIFAPAETSAVALGRPTCYRINMLQEASTCQGPEKQFPWGLSIHFRQSDAHPDE